MCGPVYNRHFTFELDYALCIISRLMERDVKRFSFSPFADVRVWMFVLIRNGRSVSLVLKLDTYGVEMFVFVSV